MEVIEAAEVNLCNAEVIAFLQEARSNLSASSSRKNREGCSGNSKAATVMLEALSYLEKTPAVKLTTDRFQSFLQRFKDLHIRLTEVELLLIMNLCPTTAVEIQLLIEDSEERLQDEQVDQLLELVQSDLLHGQKSE